MGLEPTIFDVTGRRFNQLSYIFLIFYLKYFYIDNMKFNYNLEFNTQNSKNNWKHTVSLIEYCDTLGITIPHYCYHKNLSIAGNCRMCLIELKKSPKPVVSCSMNAKSSLAANTEIYTNSPLVKKARENVMEFLLLNHPLDCPICDQGGECDLQDQSLFFGVTKKRFFSFKRIVTDKNLGTIVKTVMTRCIHCTRCVRFATEIAGVEDLGVFGRGENSEIGTYVEKTFQSELSGNVIDICPVGALTSKPYPFIGRSWELKKVSTIDPSNGFGSNIHVYLKNNKIIKILPGYNDIQWISDKTRFLFEGMFSTNRTLNKFLLTKNQRTDLSWKSIFKKLIILVYLQDHLNRHLLKINPFIVLFEETLSIETLSLLLLIQKKYSFFLLRKANETKISNDFENSLQINNLDFSSSDACLLIGVNPRYELPYLNLKLRKRFMEGNFQIFSIGSPTDLTFPTISLSSNLIKFRNIVEGNSSICKNLINSKNLINITSTEIFTRKDSSGLLQLFETFTKLNFKKGTTFNLLNTSLNENGVNILNSFKNIKKNELNKIAGLFFINNNPKTISIFNNLIELQLLKYFNSIKLNTFLIEQNSECLMLQETNKLKMLNYLYIPNNVFFENFGSYINTTGEIKKTTKIISSTQNTKDDWQILRKIFGSLKKINYISNPKYNTLITYSCNNLFNFRNFINFLFLTTKSLTKNSAYLKSQNQKFKLKKKIKQIKFTNTQIKKWIEDFYIGGFDNYSKNSKTMTSCSIVLRNFNVTF